MENSKQKLHDYLQELASNAKPGDRVPPIRDLMRRFGTSQKNVQNALQSLIEQGLLNSRVGRGTFFQGGETSPFVSAQKADNDEIYPTDQKSILILRRSISITRGRVLIEQVLQLFATENHRVIEVAYTDPEHARTILKNLPRFDACLIQSTFETITVKLMALIKEKSDVVAIDGLAYIGSDVETVGTEWGGPLLKAIQVLRSHGHERIVYVTTSHSFMASQLGQRTFEQLKEASGDVDLEMITLSQLPTEDYESEVADRIHQLLGQSDGQKSAAFVIWGIENGKKFRGLLQDHGYTIPDDLSIVLLGRTDLPNEHADFFECIGCRVKDQAAELHKAIQLRWIESARRYELRLLPITHQVGRSISMLHAAKKTLKRKVD